MFDAARREPSGRPNGLPDRERLARVLTQLLASRGNHSGELEVVDRLRSLHGTHPKEIVTCRLGTGPTLRLFCKYEDESGSDVRAHCGGVAYEAAVYQRILEPLAVSVPALIGVYREPSDGRLWLIQEYLGDNLRISHSEDSDALPRAARWLGAFHRANAQRLAGETDDLLIRYDDGYYRRWVEGTLSRPSADLADHAWLPPLCERFLDAIDRLIHGGLTIVHGEFYPKNVLYRDGTVYPVDWESTAIAADAIDLAALTEGWPEEMADRCRRAYELARWPEGAPAEFGPRLSTARLYLHLRWLGDPSAAGNDEALPLRLERLKSFADAGRIR